MRIYTVVYLTFRYSYENFHNVMSWSRSNCVEVSTGPSLRIPTSIHESLEPLHVQQGLSLRNNAWIFSQFQIWSAYIIVS